MNHWLPLGIDVHRIILKQLTFFPMFDLVVPQRRLLLVMPKCSSATNITYNIITILVYNHKTARYVLYNITT
jgi:hypothetical protein